MDLIKIYIVSIIGSLLTTIYMTYNIKHKTSVKDVIVALCPVLNSISMVCLIICLGCDLFTFIYKKFKNERK